MTNSKTKPAPPSARVRQGAASRAGQPSTASRPRRPPAQGGPCHAKAAIAARRRRARSTSRPESAVEMAIGKLYGRGKFAQAERVCRQIIAGAARQRRCPQYPRRFASGHGQGRGRRSSSFARAVKLAPAGGEPITPISARCCARTGKHDEAAKDARGRGQARPQQCAGAQQPRDHPVTSSASSRRRSNITAGARDPPEHGRGAQQPRQRLARRPATSRAR